jgi:hypothetical protein
MTTQRDNGEKSFYSILEVIIKQQRFIMRLSELDAFLERLEQKKSVSSEQRKILLDLAKQLAPQGSWIIDVFQDNIEATIRL